MDIDQVKNGFLTQKIALSNFGEAIDRQTLTELWVDIEEDEATIRELVDLFLEDATRQIINAKLSFVRGDHQELGRIAHTLKSSSLYYGAKNLSMVCRDLETICDNGQVPHTDLLVTEMEKEFELVKDALQSMVVQCD